jgi:rod shape-determining protein MreC
MAVPQTDSSRGSLIVLAALLVVGLVLTTLFFREGSSGPLHRARTGVLAVAAPLEQAGWWITSPLRAVGDFAGGLTVSKSEMEGLRAQNVQLRQQIAALTEARAENLRLGALLNLKQALQLPVSAARVIGRPTSSWEGSLVIDKGSGSGFKLGMPVVTAQGLLGQLVEVAPNASKVRLITDRRSGVAALIQSSRAPGIVRGSIEGDLSLDFLDRSFKPKIGDTVVTSGIGGVFPKGIVIGDVSFIRDQRTDPYPEIIVTSRVPIQDVEEVLVITSPLADTGAGTGGAP